METQPAAVATSVPPTGLTPPAEAPALAPPKTATPLATSTVVVTETYATPIVQAAPAQQTGVGTPGDPYATAPLCPTHDDIHWHGLWDAARGCHYNHTHNADPSAVDNVFGPAGTLFGGQSISYPWQTPHENQNKHQGYKYAVGADLPCVQDTYEYLSPQPDCVRAFRIQHHDLGGPMDAVVRFHSYFAEVQVCRRDGSSCGIIRTGGHSDFGILHVPYKQAWIPLPQKDPPELWQYVNDRSQVDLNVDPYRAYNELSLMQQMRTAEAMCKTCQGPGRELRTTWAGATQFGHADWAVGNQIVGFQFWTFDDWGGFNPNNLADYQLVCPDAQCRFNSSEHALYTVSVDVAAELDDDGDGIVNYQGFTDLNGKVATNCTVAGQNCVPLVIEHAAVGRYLYSFQAPTHDVAAITHDYDVSPEGVWWIQYPN
ncbi:MAG: hypothetical protein U0175_39760 [Caldilineaceae bacterium]